MIYKMSDPRTCNLPVKDFDFKSGDLLTAITDPSPLTQKKKSSINPTTSSLPRSRFGSLKDFADEMSPSVDIMKGSHHIGLPVVIRHQLYPIIAKIRDGGDVALLLGETSVVSEDEMSATSIQAVCMIPRVDSEGRPVESLSSSPQPQESRVLAAIKQLAVDTNLQIVGCVIGSNANHLSGPVGSRRGAEYHSSRAQTRQWWAVENVLAGVALSRLAANRTDFTVLM
jgi:hypothetical protein